MNKLFQQLNPTRPLPNNIKQMAQMFKAIKNPQEMINKAINENPQLKSILEASNGNYEQAFRNLAKQMNVDPQEIINMLK